MKRSIGGIVPVVLNSLKLVNFFENSSKEHAVQPEEFPTGEKENAFKVPHIPGNFLKECPKNVCSIYTPRGISEIS